MNYRRSCLISEDISHNNTPYVTRGIRHLVNAADWMTVQRKDAEMMYVPQWLTRRGSGQDLRSGFFWPKPFLRYPMAGFGIFFLHVVTIGLVIPL